MTQNHRQKISVSAVIRLKKSTAEHLAQKALSLKLTPAEAVERALQGWLKMPPSQALGISKAELYCMAELEGLKIDA